MRVFMMSLGARGHMQAQECVQASVDYFVFSPRVFLCRPVFRCVFGTRIS